MFNVGGSEMVVLAILALLVFGPEGLPEIIKTVARTVKAFKQAANDFQSEVNTALTLENQKRDVEARRRKRSRPIEQKLEETSSEGLGQEGVALLSAGPDQTPSQDDSDIDAADSGQADLNDAGLSKADDNEADRSRANAPDPASSQAPSGEAVSLGPDSGTAFPAVLAAEAFSPLAQSNGASEQSSTGSAASVSDEAEDDGPGRPMTRSRRRAGDGAEVEAGVASPTDLETVL